MLTNAAGGLDPSFGPGTLMVMSDHINLTGLNPLIGRNADALGERFPDLTDAWSPRLRTALHAAGAAEDVPLAEGVYVGLTGPNYETPAEVRMLAALGGHAVGMSTVLECIAARWVGLEVCGVSLVTNAGAGYSGEPLTHEEVMEAGAIAGPRLARVIRRFLTDLPELRPDSGDRRQPECRPARTSARWSSQLRQRLGHACRRARPFDGGLEAPRGSRGRRPIATASMSASSASGASARSGSCRRSHASSLLYGPVPAFEGEQRRERVRQRIR